MTTKKITLLAISALLLTSISVLAQTISTPRTPSPGAEVTQTIGISKITINYSRPAVKDREIWGTQLAHYGYINYGFGTATAAPWRGGANENTTITFSDDAMVEGKSIPAGTYGLSFGLHDSGKVDVIFSKNYESWGTYYYNEEEDQLRVTVSSTNNQHTERLTYDFMDIDKNSAIVVLDWEKKRIPFKVSFDVDKIVLANAENQLRDYMGFFWQAPASAAQYSLANKVELEKGLVWAEQAVGLQKSFNTLNLKSQLQEVLGNSTEASATMALALEEPTAGVEQYYTYGRQLIRKGKDKEAMAIYTTLSKKWPKNWLAPHGMARAYSAAGDYKKALKYEKQALTMSPEASKKSIEGFIAKLEKGENFN